MIVDVVRHAESAWGDLTPRGEEQADFFGRYCKVADLWPTVVLTSPAACARRTHELSAKVMGLDVEASVDPRLQELDRNSVRRGQPALDAILERVPDGEAAGHLLVHTHTDVIRALTALSTGQTVHTIGRVEVPALSRTRFEVKDRSLALVFFNSPTL